MKNKASNPRQHSPDPCYFLSDAVVVIAEDLPQSDRESLIGGIHAMGGQHSSLMTKLVTHVVTLTMDNAQCRIIQEKSLKCVPVLPHWLNHCFLLGRKISERPYILPDPPILEYDRDGTLKYLKADRNAGDAKIRGATALDTGPLHMPEPLSPSKTRKRLTVFRNHAVLLGDDLSINADLRNTLSELINGGGGRIVNSRDDADAIVVPFRRGLNFQHAVEQRKDVGSLSWLYHLINSNKWTDPSRKLLHYPAPHGGIGGFNKLNIGVSNYVGEVRTYLENLIKAAGGTFTKTLTQDNTHLITAHTISDKVDAAREWNISIVNHLWLEESYASWTVKTVSQPRYTTFPEKTHLCEIVGQTPIDKAKVEKFMFPDREPTPTRVGRPAALEPSSSNIQSPVQTPSSSKRSQAEADVVTPANNSDKENQRSEGRGAKSRALNKLHSMAPDIASFQKELKRKGGVVYGGRRASDAERHETTLVAGRKRSCNAEECASPTSPQGDAEIEGKAPVKRSKKNRGSVRLRFMVTGGDRFGWDVKKSRQLATIGVLEETEVDKASEVDVLVSHKILKTPKFLGAIAGGAVAVGPDWLDKMLEKETVVDAAPWALKDNEMEAEYKFDLQQSLVRARSNLQHGGLLRGMRIYHTEHIQNAATWQKIVSLNSGTCLPYKGRESRLPETRAIDNREPSEEQALYLITVPTDRKVWGKFRTMATKHGYRPIVVTHEWLLRVCMTQDLKVWEPEWDLFE